MHVFKKNRYFIFLMNWKFQNLDNQNIENKNKPL